jgi:methionyl-tRNA formyltransferase
MKIALFGGGEVGEQIATFLAREGAEVVCVAVPANDPRRAAIADLFPGRAIEADDADALRAAAPDLGLLAWWPHIVREPQLSLPKLGWLNFHPSLLPYNRGKHYNFWAIVEEAPFGVTIHWIDAGVDSGDIAFQVPLPVRWQDTGATLYDAARQAIVELFEENWPAIREGRIPRIPQPATGSFHRGAELEGASRIDLEASYRARDLLNLLRARTFEPHPGAWFVDGGVRYEVRVEILQADDDADDGANDDE